MILRARQPVGAALSLRFVFGWDPLRRFVYCRKMRVFLLSVSLCSVKIVLQFLRC